MKTHELVALIDWIEELAAVYGRYGSPRITGLLRNEGWLVNHKRVERIWRCARLKVPKKQPRRGRLWLNDGSCVRLRPERKDHVWAYDFVSARTNEGLALRMLVVVDEWTRECLSIDVARKLNSDDLLERLSWLMATRGVPEHVRSDQLKSLGPEFSAHVVRDELLDGEIFYTLREAKIMIEKWRRHYNEVRPHSSLGYKPPAPETIVTRPNTAVSRMTTQSVCEVGKLSYNVV